MYNIKINGIYKIEHSSGYYYIGLSNDIFSRWSSHYTSIRKGTHSSPKLMNLFNSTSVTEWTFTILEYISITEYKKVHQIKGIALKAAFRKHLLQREKWWMNQYSKNFCLNKNDKHFA